MIAIAIAGFLLGVGIEGERRRERFEELASARRKKLLTLIVDAHQYSEIDKKKYDYHYAMYEKYHWASRYPWFPVWPGPPEPVENPINTTASGR